MNELNLVINEGEIVGLIGANGAGKTTLAKIIIGQLKFDGGRVVYKGIDLKNYPIELRKNISISFENTSFPSWISSSELLIWVGQMRGLNSKDSEKETKFWFDKFNLEKYYNKPLSAFSSGMKHKFSLAVSFIGKPDFIILDEPTTNLDTASRFLVNDIIKDMNRQYNTTFLIFSHLLNDLEVICDKLGLLSHGKLVFYDSLQTLQLNYQNIYYNLKTNNVQLIKEFLETKFKETVTILRIDEKYKVVEVKIKNINFEELESSLQSIFQETYLTPKYSFLEDLFLRFDFKKD